jgi:hypothetical protein
LGIERGLEDIYTPLLIMSERPHYDAMLVHFYIAKSRPGEVGIGRRNHFQDVAAAHIYREGLVGTLFLGGGWRWNRNAPSFALLQKDDLVQRGVKECDIVINPLARETSQEVDLFLNAAREHGWADIASLASGPHVNRIGLIYQSRGVAVKVHSANDVLVGIRVDGQYPYRQLLDVIQNSRSENVFQVKEKILTRLYKYGFEDLCRFLSQIRLTENIKGLIDR